MPTLEVVIHVSDHELIVGESGECIQQCRFPFLRHPFSIGHRAERHHHNTPPILGDFLELLKFGSENLYIYMLTQIKLETLSLVN